MRMAAAIVLFLGVCGFVLSESASDPLTFAPKSAPGIASFHDNEVPAGTVVDGVLTVALRATEAAWHPYGEDEKGVTLPVFEEEGGAPVIPSPYLEAELGQTVEVTIENTLDSLLVVYGFGERRSAALQPWLLEPGERATRSFVADAEGTFYYFAKAGDYEPDPFRAMGQANRRSLFMSGALVVTGPEMPEPIDAVILMGVYVHGLGPAVLTMNGRPWPHTKRLQYEMGDTVRWRILNTSSRAHPMHLHGFFYDVEARGDLDESEIFWHSQKPKEVTVDMARGETMAISWVAERPGNWLFHCHISGHVGPNHYPLGERTTFADVMRGQILGHPEHDPAHHVEQGMGGLMMALNIRPSPDWKPSEGERRRVRLLIHTDSVAAPTGTPLQRNSPYRRVYSPIVEEPGTVVAPDSIRLPGSPLILREGEPTSIWVVNRTHEPTQIHWHGLEIESPFDGVVGVGGYNGMPTPPIMPSDSFEVRYTAPRPGSYLYHTHMDDIRQQGGGLYGPIVVLPEGQDWDPEHDKIMLVGFHPHAPGPHLNGQQGQLGTIRLQVGESYRFRLMNITTGPTVTFRLTAKSPGFPRPPLRWEVAAKDGSERPQQQRPYARSEQRVAVGEIYDVIISSRVPGELSLDMATSSGVVASYPLVFER